MVEMGTDRIHHGFWKYMDPEHRKHEPGNPYENAIRDYYVHVDGLIGGLLEHADDETLVLVVSDHGAKRLDGGIRINEWLRREGLLALAPSRTASRRRARSGSTGRGRPRGATAATTRASSSTSRAASRRASSRLPTTRRVRDDLAERLAAIPDDERATAGDARVQARGALRRRSTASRPT